MMTHTESRMADIAYEESRHEIGDCDWPPQPDALVVAIKEALWSKALEDDIYRLYCNDRKKKGKR